MAESWMQLKVKAIGDAQIKQLDDKFTQMMPTAFVEQKLDHGECSYELAADGTYTVRLLEASRAPMVKRIIEIQRFEIVQEIAH